MRLFLRLIYETLLTFRKQAVFAYAQIVGRVRSPHQVIRQIPERIELGPHVALFMHFDGGGGVRPAVLAYVRELIAAKRSVVFVTNSGFLSDPAIAALREAGAQIMIRRNIGYDFGAWRDAIETLALPRADTEEVIICNDSVFGPVRPLDVTLLRLNYDEADVWGLTESWQRRYHLQSYFIAFGRTALHHPGFRKFWTQVLPAPAKSFIIHRYEVGLTQAMLKAGLRVAAVWPYETLTKMVLREQLQPYLEADSAQGAKLDPMDLTRWLHVLRLRNAIAQRQALNPTSDLWRQLLLAGYPFIKRELLRDNPTRVEDVGDWADVLRNDIGADPEPIRADLRQMLKGDAP